MSFDRETRVDIPSLHFIFLTFYVSFSKNIIIVKIKINSIPTIKGIPEKYVYETFG